MIENKAGNEEIVVKPAAIKKNEVNKKAPRKSKSKNSIKKLPIS
jgi:hypothetical protein